VPPEQGRSDHKDGKDRGGPGRIILWFHGADREGGKKEREREEGEKKEGEKKKRGPRPGTSTHTIVRK